MKIGILSPIPFAVSYMLSIPILALVLGKSTLIGIGTDKYLTILLVYFATIKGLHYIYSGKIKITLTSDENLEIKIEKKPLFSKLKNQIIKLSEIEHYRVSNGKASDRIIIELKNKENVRICTDNLKNIFRLKDEKKHLINLFIEKRIKVKKASWKDGF